ncbi:MAG: energy transducer TonB [Terriglobales bacterium]|jgi:hypothetical protein
MSKRATPAPPMPGVHYVGVVTVVVSLSDTGSVCAVEVVKGIADALDKQAVDAIRQQPFQPIRLDGKPVPGFMTIQRDFWRGDTSNILVSQNADASPDEISSDAKLVHALDIASLIASGKVEGQRYWNQYFGVSFTAPRAVFTAPSVVDDQGRNVRLVDAVAGTGKREDMFTISILADRLSNYPELKSRAEYVEGISGRLQREGAKRNRDTFPYVISGVEFVATILQESDSSDMSHFRGIFSTVMKGYVLSLDIAAPSEDQVLKIASSVEFKLGQ